MEWGHKKQRAKHAGETQKNERPIHESAEVGERESEKVKGTARKEEFHDWEEPGEAHSSQIEEKACGQREFSQIIECGG